MAEVVVGTVASSITVGALGAQITSSILKLKSYWNQFQDAPEDIRDMVSYLELYTQLLADADDDQYQNPFSTLVLSSTTKNRCLRHCKAGADELKDLIDGMAADIDAPNKLQRTWASAKVVIRRDRIKKHKVKIERSIHLLTLSLQIYERAMRQFYIDLVSAQLPRNTISASIVATHNLSNGRKDSLESNGSPIGSTAVSLAGWQIWIANGLLGSLTCEKREYLDSVADRVNNTPDKSSTQIERIFWLRAPSWLVNRVWRIQALRASSGWDFRFRTYNVVPNTSLVFLYAAKDNVEGLLNLFSKMEASPYDCDEQNRTPLHVAAKNYSYNACKVILEHGANPNCRAQGSKQTPVDYAALGFNWVYRRKWEKAAVLRVNRLLYSIADLDAEPPGKVLGEEQFILWQQHANPAYYDEPLQVHFEWIMKLTHDWTSDPEVWRLGLTRGTSLPCVHALVDGDNRTLLHALATRIAIQVRFIEVARTYRFTEEINHLTEQLDGFYGLLDELLVLRPDLHIISRNGQTPFLEFIQESASPYLPHRKTQLQQIYVWLSHLWDQGVHLPTYAQNEIELYQQGQVLWDLLVRESDLRLPYSVLWSHWAIARIYHGPFPEDWQIFLELKYKLREVDHTNVPGGWVEDEGNEGGDEGDEEGDKEEDEMAENHDANMEGYDEDDCEEAERYEEEDYEEAERYVEWYYEEKDHKEELYEEDGCQSDESEWLEEEDMALLIWGHALCPE